MFYFDDHGWLTQEVIRDRATEVPPPESVPEGHHPNWTGVEWINIPYTAPEPGLDVPIQVSQAQARIALLDAGYLDLVEAAIQQMPGIEGRRARITWEFASFIRRDDPLTLQMADALGMSIAQMDALFIYAATR